MLPPLSVISLSSKLVVDSLEVNVKAIESSLLEAPSLTVELLIAIVGPVRSITKSGIVSDVAFPVASVTVTVLPLYVPSLSALKVIVLLPTAADEDVEKPSLILEVIVPTSSLVNTKLGVVSVDGVVIAVAVDNVGTVVSTVTLPVPLVTAEPAMPVVSENATE